MAVGLAARAGFTATSVRTLGSDDLAAALAHRGDAGAGVTHAKTAVLDACRLVIATGDPQRMMRAEGVVRTLARGKVVEQETRNPELDAALATLRERIVARDRAEPPS